MELQAKQARLGTVINIAVNIYSSSIAAAETAQRTIAPEALVQMAQGALIAAGVFAQVADSWMAAELAPPSTPLVQP